jgi:hypothetical protein
LTPRSDTIDWATHGAADGDVVSRVVFSLWLWSTGVYPLFLITLCLFCSSQGWRKLVCNNTAYSVIKACAVIYLEFILYEYDLLRSCVTVVASGGDPTDPWVIPFEVHLRSSCLCKWWLVHLNRNNSDGSATAGIRAIGLTYTLYRMQDKIQGYYSA